MYRREEWPDTEGGGHKIGRRVGGWAGRSQSVRSNSDSSHKAADVEMSHVVDLPVLIAGLACSSIVCPSDCLIP